MDGLMDGRKKGGRDRQIDRGMMNDGWVEEWNTNRWVDEWIIENEVLTLDHWRMNLFLSVSPSCAPPSSLWFWVSAWTLIVNLQEKIKHSLAYLNLQSEWRSKFHDINQAITIGIRWKIRDMDFECFRHSRRSKDSPLNACSPEPEGQGNVEQVGARARIRPSKRKETWDLNGTDGEAQGPESSCVSFS